MTSSTGHRALYPGEATSFARAGISPAEAMDWTAMGLNAHQALEAVKSGRSLDDSTGSGDGDTPSVSGPRVSRDLALIRRNLLVTTSEIAVLAGKDLSAVTHWRKGQKKFPEPVVGGRSPLFNLEEVHAWLERNDKLANQPVAAWLWRKSVQALHQSTSGDDRSRLRGYVTAMVVVVHDFLDDVGGFVELRLTSGFERWLSETNPGLDDDLVEFLRQHLLGMDPEKETTRCAARAFRHALGCGFTRCGLLDEALDALAELSATRTTTSLPLSSLITDLACDLAGPPESVVDLACGEATLLTDLMNRSRSPDVRLRGVERDPDTAAIARIRLHLHHPGADWRIRVGDSLSGAGWGESFDVVVVDPPTRNAGKWVDLARSSLTADDTSRAFVLLPESALRANGPCTSEIERGRLEAVVRLPSRLKRESRGLALCIFTSDLVTCEEILVIDLSDLKLKNLGYGTATPTISETGEGLPTAETCAAISRWRSTQTIDRALLQGRQRSISNYEAAVDGLTEAGLTEVRSSEMGLSPVLEFQLQAMPHEAASPSLLRQDIRFLRSTPDQAGKRCSFCGRTEDQVEQLITGIDAHICDVCVFRFNSSLHE